MVNKGKGAGAMKNPPALFVSILRDGTLRDTPLE